jgi:hypothetical protein
LRIYWPLTPAEIPDVFDSIPISTADVQSKRTIVSFSVVFIAIQLGHSFGASHSFDHAGRGGIMDYYKAGKLRGVFQFQPVFRRLEICRMLIWNEVSHLFFECSDDSNTATA